MTRILAMFPAIALLAVAACNKSDAHEGHDHATRQSPHHEMGDHEMAEGHAQLAAADVAKRIIPISVGDKGFQPSRVGGEKGGRTRRFVSPHIGQYLCSWT